MIKKLLFLSIVAVLSADDSFIVKRLGTNKALDVIDRSFPPLIMQLCTQKVSNGNVKFKFNDKIVADKAPSKFLRLNDKFCYKAMVVLPSDNNLPDNLVFEVSYDNNSTKVVSYSKKPHSK